jgi:ATP-dependent helicase HrpA
MKAIEETPMTLQDGRAAIDRASSRDRGRLLGLWSRWRAQPRDVQVQARFGEVLAASLAAREAMAASLPRAQVDPALPIATEAERIVALIREHPVVVVAGETGSGKTTQLPKLCLAAGRGAAGMIGCTQPRRIAARAVARRVAEELRVPLGGAVGFQVRFNEQVGERTAVKFMTDGILLAEISSDPWLSRYDTLIVDEAHERSLNIDFLLGYLRMLLPRRPDLKLLVTSATIDTTRFSRHFGDAPVVDVQGRGHPVEVRWRPLGERGSEGEMGSESFFPRKRSGRVDPGKNDSDPISLSPLDGIVAACDEIMRERSPHGPGDVLVFLPGEREIREAHRALEARRYRHVEVLPLYARLSARDQDRVFNPGPQRRIVLATNVAETSLTVPRIHYVVDPGLARVKRYSPRAKLDRLHIEPVSQASAEQRKGRCGRIAPGTCIRLYSEADFLSRPEYTDPEIRRASLAGVILRMLALGLGRIEAPSRGRRRKGGAGGARDDDPGVIERFPFLEPPEPRAIADGWQQLAELGAVDGQRRLTDTGRTMARLPVDVKLARMLVAAQRHDCLRGMLAIASFLGIQDPRERPADRRAAADAAHAQFADPKSEFVGILNLWEAYRVAHEDLTQSQLRKWAERNFLGFLRLREWRELHRQLKLLCEELGWTCRPDPGRDPGEGPASVEGGNSRSLAALGTTGITGYAALHRALVAGLPGNIGHRIERNLYEGPRGRRFQPFPGSALASKPPLWVLSATLLDTEKVWAMTNAAIEPEWAIDELPHLLARRRHDPRWSRSQGRVLGSEQVSLFGLVLAPKRPIHYGALFPEESRAIFARDALVTGEIDVRAGFLARNLATLARAREEEARQRRAGLVVDEDWMAQWYLDRLPAHVHNAQALDAWYRGLDPQARAALEWSLDELLLGDESEAARFPKFLVLGESRLPVQYRFEPGAPDDGMTVSVPLHLLGALDAARLSWLAPGFVADKAAALIRSLPKAQRRNFVPAPDFARAFAQAHPQPEADALAGTLARFLRKATGAAVAATDFDEAALEPHLRANLRLLDEDRRTVLAESRDLDDLRDRFGSRAAAAFAARAAEGLARARLTGFPDTPVPESVSGAGGVPAFPALHDDGDAVSLRVHADRAQAGRAHPAGVRRLLRIALAERMRQARRQLPVRPKTALLYAALESAADDARRRQGDVLREDLVEGAFAALADDAVLAGIRDRQAFADLVESVGRGLFPAAVAGLEQAEAILDALSAARAALDGGLVGWASGNLDDMRAQLEALAPPGFLRTVPPGVLRDYPRWLRALALRAERALRDPARDQARMLELKPFADALARARAAGVAHEPGWQALRWQLEELRVQLFAQELGTRTRISAKRLASMLAQLEPAP